jgi:HD-GYP domain-containing protein (c-di-GMP phosphodiesterase class II)
LQSCCRSQDIIARWGGDEYAVLLPEATESEVRDICDRIYHFCEDRAQSNDGGSAPSISLGHATRGIRGESVAALLKIAEDTMYKRKLLESRSLHSSIVASIRTTLLEKSHETEEHAARLINITRAIGDALGLSPERLDDLELFSILHDMGKIGISDQILNKTSPLNTQEWEEIRKHPEIGFRIAQASPEIVHIAEYILCHHERWDGNGYPQGLRGRAIPLAARILAIADSYDAMTSNRIYRRAMPAEQAIGEIRRCAGTQFDPDLVEVFLSDRVRSVLLGE